VPTRLQLMVLMDGTVVKPEIEAPPAKGRRGRQRAKIGETLHHTIINDGPDYRSPRAEALELRGFEGMTGRPVK
jgi:hypothetical protein